MPSMRRIMELPPVYVPARWTTPWYKALARLRMPFLTLIRWVRPAAARGPVVVNDLLAPTSPPQQVHHRHGHVE